MYISLFFIYSELYNDHHNLILELLSLKIYMYFYYKIIIIQKIMENTAK